MFKPLNANVVERTILFKAFQKVIFPHGSDQIVTAVDVNLLNFFDGFLGKCLLDIIKTFQGSFMNAGKDFQNAESSQSCHA